MFGISFTYSSGSQAPELTRFFPSLLPFPSRSLVSRTIVIRLKTPNTHTHTHKQQASSSSGRRKAQKGTQRERGEYFNPKVWDSWLDYHSSLFALCFALLFAFFYYSYEKNVYVYIEGELRKPFCGRFCLSFGFLFIPVLVSANWSKYFVMRL